MPFLIRRWAIFFVVSVPGLPTQQRFANRASGYSHQNFILPFCHCELRPLLGSSILEMSSRFSSTPHPDAICVLVSVTHLPRRAVRVSSSCALRAQRGDMRE